ncbi:MAG: SCO family protein [Flavobacteriaceae bacterium]
MKSTLKIILLLCLTFNYSCKKTDQSFLYQCPMHCQGETTFSKPGACPVCGMDLLPVDLANPSELNKEQITEESIFNLDSRWNTQSNESIQLKELQGKTLVIVMIYTSCKAACPRLVADMRNIEEQIPKTYDKKINYVFVSIDPTTDSPEKLQAFAKENQMTSNKFVFLQGTPQTVREFANVLAVKYKQINPLDFSHSNIISVFDPQGELVYQQEGLGVSNKATVNHIIETLQKSN